MNVVDTMLSWPAHKSHKLSSDSSNGHGPKLLWYKHMRLSTGGPPPSCKDISLSVDRSYAKQQMGLQARTSHFPYGRALPLTVCRYDLLHNSHLNLEGLDELFKVAQLLADGVIPNENGINPKQKLKIGSKVNLPGQSDVSEPDITSPAQSTDRESHLAVDIGGTLVKLVYSSPFKNSLVDENGNEYSKGYRDVLSFLTQKERAHTFIH